MIPVTGGNNDNLDLSKLYDGLLNNLGIDPAKVDGKTLESLFAQYQNFTVTDGKGRPVSGGKANRKVNLTRPDLKKAGAVDYQKLVDMLDSENIKVQLAQAKKRYQNLMKKLDSTSTEKNFRFVSQAAAQERQENQSIVQKILAGIAVALAAIVAVAVCVGTGGAGAPAAIAAIVAAAFAAVSFIMDVSGGNEAIVESMAEDFKGPNCNASEAKLKASKIWGGVQIGLGLAVAIGTFGAGMFGAASETVNTTAKVVQSVTSTIALAHGMGQTGFAIYTAVDSRDASEDSVELIGLDKYVSTLTQHIEEEEEAINTIMDLLEKGIQNLADMMQGNYENELKLAENNIQYG